MTETADDLTANNVPDLLANEQTWPTEEEMNSAPAVQGEGAATKPPRVKRVPKGTSAYQAAWIVDDDEDDDVDGQESGSDMGSEDMGEGASVHHCEFASVLSCLISDSDEEEMEEIELDSREQEYDDMAPEDEEEQ